MKSDNQNRIARELRNIRRLMAIKLSNDDTQVNVDSEWKFIQEMCE